jgi:sorbitol/mannitol transport system substrate-binding protein
VEPGDPVDVENADQAWEFLSWATSKDYAKLVGEELGWSRVPPGARLSTYEIPEYQEEAAPSPTRPRTRCSPSTRPSRA